MRLLLDTHIALWAVTASPLLPPKAEAAILAAEHVVVSVASLWEIAIKHALGRGDMPVSSAEALDAFGDAGYALLDIKPAHALQVERLDALHPDPFDRLQIAQAMAEPLILLTHDTWVGQYGRLVMRV